MIHKSICSFQSLFVQRNKEKVVKKFFFQIIDVRLWSSQGFPETLIKFALKKLIFKNELLKMLKIGWFKELTSSLDWITASFIIPCKKMKFSIMDFFSKCGQIRRKLRIWSHLLKKSLMENFFCAVIHHSSWQLHITWSINLKYKNNQSSKS